MSKAKLNWLIPALIIFAILSVLASGCAPRTTAPEQEGQKQESVEPEQEKANENPEPKTEKVTLYFSDSQAMYLVPEERQVEVGQGTLEEAIIRELIKGPQNPDLRKTIPDGARLLSLTVKDGVAYVNFSAEFQSKHSGGSAGEMMTIHSVTNSLGKIKGIERVQFLLEGQKQESILGHADTTVPIAPNWNLVAK